MARRLGLTKNIDIGICGDAKMAAEAIGHLLEGSSPACLETTNERLGLAKQEKAAWEQGKISLHKKNIYVNTFRPPSLQLKFIT